MTSGCFFAAAVRLAKPLPDLSGMRVFPRCLDFRDGKTGIFGSDGTGFVAQEPVVYFAVQGHGFAPIRTGVFGWYAVRRRPFGCAV